MGFIIRIVFKIPWFCNILSNTTYSNCLWGFCVWALFWFAVLCVFSSFAVILLGKRGLVALLLWSSECHFSVVVLCLFLAVPWVGLWCVVVASPGCAHLLFFCRKSLKTPTVKPVLNVNGHSNIDKTEILMTNGSLMKVKSIVECILQYF